LWSYGSPLSVGSVPDNVSGAFFRTITLARGGDGRVEARSGSVDENEFFASGQGGMSILSMEKLTEGRLVHRLARDGAGHVPSIT
jgi:hypothetical protein